MSRFFDSRDSMFIKWCQVSCLQFESWVKMADVSVVVSNLLCFLTNKYGKCAVKLKFHWDQFPRNFLVTSLTSPRGS